MREFCLSAKDGTVLYDGEAVLHRYENAIMCVPDELSGAPDFGIVLPIFVGETVSDATAMGIKTLIQSQTKKFFKEIAIQSIIIEQLNLQINVRLTVTVTTYGITKEITKMI